MELIVNVPHTLKHVVVPLKRFIDAMVYKLHVHRSKGRWEALDLDTTLLLLEEEVTELKNAMGDGNSIDILLESADVANFAMIASSIALERMVSQTLNKKEETNDNNEDMSPATHAVER